MIWSRRMTYAACAVAVIGAGLYCRWPSGGMPPVFAKYAGSILWGALVYLAAAWLLSRQNIAVALLVASVVAVTVEFSQLLHWPWLDQFRRTTLGVLLLGRYFSWGDIAAYLTGIAIVGSIDRVVIRR